MNGVARIGRGMKCGIIPLLFAVVWELAIRRRWLPEGLAPSPSQVLDW